MGIDAFTLETMYNLAQTHNLPSGGLCLGRQSVNRRPELTKIEALLEKWNLSPKNPMIRLKGFEFIEEVLGMFGVGAFESMDMSNYEGAHILHDLNEPVPDEFYNRYGMIYDGGTTEHIFNIPTAFDNIYAMLAQDGIFVSSSMMNGGPTHGLYQFGPDIVWSYWKRKRKCEVLMCKAYPIRAEKDYPMFDLPDVGLKGKRYDVQHKLPKSETYLFYVIKKRKDDATANEKVVQSDYEVRWKKVLSGPHNV